MPASLLPHPEPHALARPEVVVVGAPHLVLQDDGAAPQGRGDPQVRLDRPPEGGLHVTCKIKILDHDQSC